MGRRARPNYFCKRSIDLGFGIFDFGFRKFRVKLVKVKGYFSNHPTDTKHHMAESDLGSFAVAPEASLAIAEDEDIRMIVRR